MDADIKNVVRATDQDAQYDDKAKRLLGNIEGEPFISVVPVESGLTNTEKEKAGQRIVGMNTENAEINEGLIRYAVFNGTDCHRKIRDY